MKLALFDDYRLGVVSPDEQSIVDVSPALPWAHDPDPLVAGWWRWLCRDFPVLRGEIQAAARGGPAVPLASVRLRAPVLNPSKVVATALNYAEHVAEMQDMQHRIGAMPAWMLEFDVFLKAPSSIVGAADSVVLPGSPEAAGREVHHESELALVIGRGGSRIPPEEALDYVLGYTIGLDMTVRGDGDRSRRKSYDTFTPLGPWVVTADEVGDPHALEIKLTLGDQVRQHVNSGDMVHKIPEILAYASSIMRLEPGDVILTGAPPGVGQIRAGDVMEASISRIGAMRVPVRGVGGVD